MTSYFQSTPKLLILNSYNYQFAVPVPLIIIAYEQPFLKTPPPGIIGFETSYDRVPCLEKWLQYDCENYLLA